MDHDEEQQARLICRGHLKKDWADADEEERRKCRKILREVEAIMGFYQAEKQQQQSGS